MLSESIKNRLTERFTAPLADFHKRRIVFWLDEDGEFKDEIDQLVLPDVKIIRLTDSNNFAIKKLLAIDDTTSAYLVYDPLTYERDGRDDWLLDIKLYSEAFRADLLSLQMEELQVEPSAAMRKTIKLYEKFLDNKERKAKLRRIGRNYQAPLQLHIDIMAVLCGLNGGTPQDVIIAVLTASLDKEQNDALNAIEKFGSIEAFWSLVNKFTGYSYTEDRSLGELAAHILLTALSQTMPASALRGLERYISETHRAYCYQLIHEWQYSNDNVDLEELCREVEHELRLSDRFDKMDIDVLVKSDILPAINESIIKRFMAEIGDQVIRWADIITVVENRRTAAWYDLTKDYLESLFYIAKMQEYYVAHMDSFHLVEPVKVWNLYRTDAYQMDSHYRHFHVRFGRTLKRPNHTLEDALKQCADVVEGLYREWYLQRLSSMWTNAITSDMKEFGYVTDITRQKDFYSRYVYPNVSKGSRVFVVISDALRYEVAAELAETLGHATKGIAQLEAMQAVLPSITKFGSAALLPGKESSLNEKMEILLDGKPTRGTAQRDAILKSANPASIAVTYKTLLPLKQQERRDFVAGKEVIYIYHNTIDAAGDDGITEAKVFEACDDAIEELTALIKIITNDLSGTNILITADHGFLYTYQPLEESMKINRQTFDGNVLELGRRYSIVLSETTADYLLPVALESTMQGEPIKSLMPLDTVRMKIQGGGENYVHGGLSLQEMVVPLIVYKGVRAGQKRFVEVKNPGLSLISDSRKISNLMFSLDFLQKQSVGDKVQPCTYNLLFTNEEGAPVSDFQTVIANRTSNNASERVYRVRFTLKPMQYKRDAIYRLVISNDTDVPEEEEFRIDIAFADDFGFDL